MTSTTRPGPGTAPVGRRPRRAPGSRPAPPPPLWKGPRGEVARLALFCALVALVALAGGAARGDAWQLLVLRPGVVLLATAALLIPGPAPAAAARAPAALLAALAAAITVQLVPLPPGWWTALPARAPYLAAAAGGAQPWRPITLSVDMTLNSLVALLVPGAVLLGVALLGPRARAAAAGVLVAALVASALAGLLQLSAGGPYLYDPTNLDRPVGLFANVNHHAAALAATIPIAAAWAIGGGGRDAAPSPPRAIAGAGAGVFMLAVVLVSGSRSGLLLAVAGVAAVPLVLAGRIALPGRWRRWAAAGAAAGVAGLAAAVWAAGRLGALARFGDGDARTDFLPVTLGLLRAHFPVGSGFGTFDPVFRGAEPDAMLRYTYFNHAHNDLLELGITGGLPALAVAAGFVAWLGVRAWRLAGAERAADGAPLARAGVAAAAILALASLADYPLRAPLGAAILALACLWAGGTRGRPASAR